MGTIHRSAVRILSSADGARGQINFGTGLIQRELIAGGFTHVKVAPISYENSLLSVYGRKPRGDSNLSPLKHKDHGGSIVDLPLMVGSWLGPDWRLYIQGRGWISLDVHVGDDGVGSSMRLLLPTSDQLSSAKLKKDALPFYPEFD